MICEATNGKRTTLLQAANNKKQWNIALLFHWIFLRYLRTCWLAKKSGFRNRTDVSAGCLQLEASLVCQHVTSWKERHQTSWSWSSTKPKVTTPGLSSFEPKVNKSPLKLIPRKMTCDNGGNTQSRLSDSRWDSAQIQSNAMIQKHLKTISPCCLFEMAYSLGRYSISLSCDSPLIASHCTSIYEVKSWLASASGTATQVVEGTLQWEVVQVLKFKLLANQHSRIVRM